MYTPSMPKARAPFPAPSCGDESPAHDAPISNSEREEFSEGNWGNLGNSTSLSKLTNIQFKAIELAVQGFNDTEIATILSIDRKTLWNWRNHNDDYLQALTDARTALHSSLIDHYQNILVKATDVLDGLLENADDNTRLRAAQSLLRSAAVLRPPREPSTAQVSDDSIPLLPPKMG